MNDHSALIPANPDNPFPLGRHLHHDPGNANHLALVRPPPRTNRPGQAWATSVVWDQGDSPRCTEEAATGMLRTAPYNAQFTERLLYDTPEERQDAYLRWQQYDPPAWGPHDGSATDSPLKGLRAAGSITGWKWLMGESQVREYVTWFGPIVVGTVWLDDMFYPDGHGFLKVSGAVAGGHAYRIVQFHSGRDAYRVVNSWGKTWGQAGRAWLARADLVALLAQDGDAATISL